MKKNFLFTFTLCLLFSCNKKFNDVGSEIFDQSFYQSKKVKYPVKISHHIVDFVQTNNAPVLMLGENNNSLFGKTEATIVSQLNIQSYNPTFGNYTSQQEIDSIFNENETVKEVWLEIPFFTNQNDSDGDGLIDEFDVDDNDPNSDSDGDGISDFLEIANGTDPTKKDTDGDGIDDGEDDTNDNTDGPPTFYAVDSLFGSRNANFNVEVNKLNHYLRQLDPELNFEETQRYYSDFSFDEKKELLLANTNVTLDLMEVARENQNNLSPRLRVPLNIDVFQNILINKEGDFELSSSTEWFNFFRSISIETSNFSNSLLMLLNTNQMVIRVVYDYLYKNTEEEVETLSDEFLLNTVGAVKFNNFNKTVPPSSDFTEIINENNSKIALSGGLGSISRISFLEDQEVLENLKRNQWLINEVNLTFYVNDDYVNQNNLILPERLYLYNSVSNLPLIDFYQDLTSVLSLNKTIYGGFLIEDENKRYYKIRITEHFKNIFNKDSINVPINLAVVPDFSVSQQIVPMSKANGNSSFSIPSGTVSSPKSLVIHGPGSPDENLNLELEIFYTEYQ